MPLASGQARATLLGTSAGGELIGSRDVSVGPSGGLKGFNDYDNGVFTVAWEITLGSTVHYKYTFTGLSGFDISNIVLDVTDDPSCAIDPECVTSAMITPGGSATVEFGDFAGITGGVKFEGFDGVEGAMYEFDSNRSPVYGHLAVKDGGGSETCASPNGTNIVCSNQLLGLGDPDEAINFIVVPNGLVPEPGTAALLGLGFLGLGLKGRRRRCPAARLGADHHSSNDTKPKLARR
jgi:hypothetical protein